MIENQIESETISLNKQFFDSIWSIIYLLLNKIPDTYCLAINESDIHNFNKKELMFGELSNEGKNKIILSLEKKLLKISNRMNTEKDIALSQINIKDLLKLIVLDWKDPNIEKPPHDKYFLGRIYGGYPAILLRMKNKYFIAIPPETTKDKKAVYVEVTKGLKSWTALPEYFIPAKQKA